MSRRLVCWFSCGAASAVATKLAIVANAQSPDPLPVVVARCRIDEEHADNDRFAADCSRWFGLPIVELSSDRFGSSIYAVFERERYLAGIAGAPCTRALKKKVRERFQRPGDINVFGYTVEEQSRADAFEDANNAVRLWPILVERGLTHADCLGMVERAGIELPAMYRLGYRNNNCVGCVKGGAGYWNKVRVDFPEAFAKMADLERSLGVRLVWHKNERTALHDLPPDAGEYQREPAIECGIFCELASQDIAA